MSVSIIGVGVVGGAIRESFEVRKINCIVYDKYKNIGVIEECLSSKLIFICLPTPYCQKIKGFDVMEIIDTCNILSKKNYSGIIVIKSTVEPGTTKNLCELYPNLKIIHNPEFLSAKTARNDFESQVQIILGKGINCTCDDIEFVKLFYAHYYPFSKITVCNSDESECVKLFCNSFYAVKIQFFNELYDLCQQIKIDYDLIKNIMLDNGWINKMHTDVPGHDGKLSFGGMCLPKDLSSLLCLMQKNNALCSIVESTINERNKLRSD